MKDAFNNKMTPESSSSTQPSANMMTDEQYDYVEQVNDELNCAICHEPFVDPVSHNSCGNTFCSKCIITILKCPMCSEDDFKKNCSPSPKTIRNIVDQLKVRCGMCKNIVSRGELKDHKEKYCPLHDAYKQVEQLKEQLQQEFNEKTLKLEQEFVERSKKLEQESNEVKLRLEKEFQELGKSLGQEFKLKQDAFTKLKSEFDSQVLVREKIEKSNKPIHLNVRGTIMTVSLGDFINNEREPDNLFKKMFNGEYPLYQTPSKAFDDPIYFINCDPIIFKHILDWLTFGIIPNELYENNLDRKNLIIVAKSFGIDFRKVILQNFKEINEMDFSEMNLNNVKMTGSILKNCNFTNCKLSNINLSDCKFINVKFINTSIEKSKMENTIYEQCKISIHFKNTNLKYCKFIKCNVEESKFIESKFTESVFEEIDFKFIKHNLIIFNNCIIINSDLTELKDLSNFKGFKFDSCLFNFNQFTNNEIENIKFENISFENVNDLISNIFTFKNVKFVNCKGILESLIISDYNILSTIFEETKSKLKPELLYRGSRDGFNAENFHSKCDNQGPTLTIIKSEYDQIFGGFTSKSWQSDSGELVSDDFAFIFKILNPKNGNYQFKKFNIKQNEKDKAICLNKDYLPIFGGYDFIISNDCNLNNNSGSNFGSCYELPNGIECGSNEANIYLAGSYEFKVKEIEVFKIYQ